MFCCLDVRPLLFTHPSIPIIALPVHTLKSGKEKYLQHNPAVANGLDALGKALEAMAKAGTPMTYSKNHMILGE